MLDAAAIATLARRAGGRLEYGAPVHDPTPVDPRPELPAEVLLDTQLRTEALTLAREHNLRAPLALIPHLLRLALAGQPELFLHAAGPTGARLAQANPEWHPLLPAVPARFRAGLHPDDGVPADEATGLAGDEVWRLGTTEERLVWLGRLRQSTPDQARPLFSDVLTGTRETPEFRAAVVGLLEHGDQLGNEEALLERCLDARASVVASAARRALRRRPDSALMRRMSERCERWIHLEATPRRLLRPAQLSWHSQLPETLDADALRDGLRPQRTAGIGGGDDVLGQLLTMVPLQRWESAGPIPQVLAAGRELPAVCHGLLRRTALERNRDWAEAFLAERTWPEIVDAADAAALAPLVSPETVGRVTRQLLTDTSRTAVRSLELWLRAVPLSAELTTELLAALPPLTGVPPRNRLLGVVADRIARELPPVWEAQLRAAALQSDPYAARHLDAAADLQALRARLHALVRATRPNAPSPVVEGDQQ